MLSPVQTDTTLLGFYTLRPFAHASVCTPCCMLLGVAAQSFKPVKRLATCKRTQQLPALLGQQWWELLSPFAVSFKEKRPKAS